MTADEILKEMESKSKIYDPNTYDFSNVLKLISGYRELLGLHKAEEYQLPAKFRGGEKGVMDTFYKCNSCFGAYPCPTRQIIERALGAK